MPVDVAIAEILKQVVASKEVECQKRLQQDWDSEC
jgi:hypothetical protein